MTDNGLTDDETVGLRSVARFVHEAGHLKAVPRTGWFLAGVRDPESVAEHMSRTSIIGLLLGALSPEPVDVGRIVLMCSIHDIAETRIGDIPSVARRYLDKPDERTVLSDQVVGMPEKATSLLTAALAEYEERTTAEAQLARDADKLECLAQAMHYRANGNPNAEQWIKSSYESLSTLVARQLADALVASEPEDWWRAFVANYRPAMKP